MIKTYTNHKATDKFVYLYYIILLLVLCAVSGHSAPPMIIRLIYTSLVFLPVLFTCKYFFPSCLLTFYTIGVNGQGFGYLPYSSEFYLILTFLFAILNKKYLNKESIVLFFYSFFILFVDKLNNGSISALCLTICILGLLLVCTNLKDDRLVSNLLFSFCLISLVLSIIYFITYQDYLVDYGSNSGLMRSGYKDPNYLSCILGMGLVVSVCSLLKQKKIKLIFKCFFLLTIAMSFIAQILLASRGGILASVSSLLILLIFSKIQFRYKLIFLAISIILAYFLFQNNFFDLLIYRFQLDDGTGSGRSLIWQQKLNAYYNSDFLHKLFGYGFDGAFQLGFTKNTGFHNDFIAFLCGYGIVGFCFFCFIIFYPLFSCKKKNITFILTLYTYFLVCLLTLEPLNNGNLTYWGFFFLIYLVSLLDYDISDCKFIV